MARVCKDVMNDVSTDLEFTTESPEDFKEKKLPTLDFKLWLKEGRILNSYFEKDSFCHHGEKRHGRAAEDVNPQQ